MVNFKKFLKFSKSFSKNLPKINLLFIFVFLNIWDYVLSRDKLNAMILGAFMFGPVAFLWYLGSFRAIALLTLISIVEFTLMLIFLLQGFELGGFELTAKTLFWLPNLLMAGVNGYCGLKIYSEHREARKPAKLDNSGS